MLLSMYYLQDGIARLRVLAGLFNTQSNNITQLRGKTSAAIADMVFACEEAAFTLDRYQFSRFKEDLLEANRIVTRSKDKDQIRMTLESIIEIFNNVNYEEASVYEFKKDCNMRAMRFFHTETSHLNSISQAIPVLHRDIQFLDSRCNDGENLKDLTSRFEKKITYGIEADQNVANRARENLDRIAIGQFAGSRITNEAFDVLVTEPLISWIVADTGLKNPIAFKNERVFLLNTIKYLRPNGIGIMFLPYFKLHKDVCLFIAKYYTNVQIRKLGADFQRFGSVVITGTKREDVKEIDESIYQMLRKCHDPQQIKDIETNPLDTYTLPRDLHPIEIFRGSILDKEELSLIVKSSGCMDNFWKNQKVEKLSESSKQPLLPFNIGQIGLVLTSGCLDGIIDEGNGNYHIIKGKVSKQSSIEQNYNSETELETQETISNRVEINVVLSNGDYKVLA